MAAEARIVNSSGMKKDCAARAALKRRQLARDYIEMRELAKSLGIDQRDVLGESLSGTAPASRASQGAQNATRGIK